MAIQVNNAGDYEAVQVSSQSGALNATCFVFETDFYIESGSADTTFTQFYLQDAVYMINVTEENGNIAFSFRPVGYGCQNVEAVVEAGLEAGVEWFIVEQDASPDRPALESAKMSIDTLKKLGLK